SVLDQSHLLRHQSERNRLSFDVGARVRATGCRTDARIDVVELLAQRGDIGADGDCTSVLLVGAVEDGLEARTPCRKLPVDRPALHDEPGRNTGGGDVEAL